MITGKTLLDLGHKPGPWFKPALDALNAMGELSPEQLAAEAAKLAPPPVEKVGLRGASSRMIDEFSDDELFALARAQLSRAAFARSLGTLPYLARRPLARRMLAAGLTLNDLWPNRKRRTTEAVQVHYSLDLSTDLHAYFYGLALSDGSIRSNERNSGALSIELNSADDVPLRAFHERLPWKSRIAVRSRLSPFNGAEVSMTAYVCHSYDLRAQLFAAGFPIGKKSGTCSPPTVPHSEASFWRGFVDGDGSVGITGAGLPFVTLTSASGLLTNAYSDFVLKVCGYRPCVKPNARDGLHNVMVTRTNAVQLCRTLYSEETVSIPRKLAAARTIMAGDWQHDAHWRRKKKPPVDTVAEEARA